MLARSFFRREREGGERLPDFAEDEQLAFVDDDCTREDLNVRMRFSLVEVLLKGSWNEEERFEKREESQRRYQRNNVEKFDAGRHSEYFLYVDFLRIVPRKEFFEGLNKWGVEWRELNCVVEKVFNFLESHYPRNRTFWYDANEN